MDKHKAIDLIKAKTLGCLTKDEDAELKEYMESGEEFPWDVVGEFQNLTAMLPVLLQLEVPDSELKDNVARKLYKIIEELKAKQQAELAPVPETEIAEDLPELETVTEEKEVLIEEPLSIPADEDIKFSEPDLSQLRNENRSEMMFPAQETEEKSRKETVQEVVDEKLERQRTIEYVESYYKEEMLALEKSSKRTRLFSIILFVISLILLGAVYFLLSTEISSNKEEIENLKIGFNESRTILLDETLI